MNKERIWSNYFICVLSVNCLPYITKHKQVLLLLILLLLLLVPLLLLSTAPASPVLPSPASISATLIPNPPTPTYLTCTPTVSKCCIHLPFDNSKKMI